jgi:hypothetical protein
MYQKAVMTLKLSEKSVPDKSVHFMTQNVLTPTSKTVRFRAAGMQEKLNKNHQPKFNPS